MADHDSEEKDLEKDLTPHTSVSSLAPGNQVAAIAATAPSEAVNEVLQIPSHSSAEDLSSNSEKGVQNPRPASVASETRDPIKVPRSNRRGLLARFAIIAEVEDPIDYPRKTKWIITFVVALAGAAAPMGSSIILPALSGITRDFKTTETVANLSVAFYMLSMSIFPLWWSSFSETLGRRTIYLSSFVLFLIFNILSAVSTSISMFIVMRILSGGASASVQAVGAGTVADVWQVKERGRAMGIFYLGPLCGPLLAPIVGGALAQGLGWRSTMWFSTIYGAVLWLGILLFLPETLKARRPIITEAEEQVISNELDASEAERTALSRTTTRQSVKMKTKKYGVILHRCFLEPLAIILNVRVPAVALTVYYSSITFGCLYVLNISVQQTFSRPPYGFSTIIIGLLYIPNSLGYIIASIFGGRWVDSIMHREARKANRYDAHGKLIFRPEDRMRENAWLGALIYPAALIWYGWTADKGVYWFAPMCANFFFGIGSMIIFGLITTMLTEFMPGKASHGIALNNFCRNILSCVGTLVASPVIDWCGDGWLFTFLGLWCLLSGCVTIWAMRHYGERWRAHRERKLAAMT